MAVHRPGLESEGLELGAQAPEIEDFTRPAHGLELVLVDDHHEPMKLVVTGEEHALPDRAFVHLTVTDDDERPLIGSTASGGEGQTDPDREAVSQ